MPKTLSDIITEAEKALERPSDKADYLTVRNALLSERQYQEQKWNPEGDSHRHTPTEWLVYMQDYIQEAMHASTRMPDPEANLFVMNSIRKVAAMGVAAMQQNGAPNR